MSIYVGNLSYDVKAEDLNAVFAEYGSVKRVQLPTDRETGRPRGFGFVEMPNDDQAQAQPQAVVPPQATSADRFQQLEEQRKAALAAMEEQRAAMQKSMEEQQKAMQKYHEEMMQSRTAMWQNPNGVTR